MPLTRIISPFSQGELDGFCGVYAIVNAIKHLFPKDCINEEELFYFIIDCIEEKNNPKLSTVIKNGMSRQTLVYLLNQVTKYFNLHDEKELEILIDKKSLDSKRIDSAINEMRNYLKNDEVNARRVIIVGIDGRMNHWTCINDIKANSISFHDGVMKSYKISDFHITQENGKQTGGKYNICYKNVILLEAIR